MKEIKSATTLPEIDLKRHLQSLACAKFKVLKKHPPSRDVNDSDTFSFNSDFTASMQRIKISTIAGSSKVENAEERKETRDRIEEERKHQIDVRCLSIRSKDRLLTYVSTAVHRRKLQACIVRVMKDRKHMSHNDLINEVTRQLASRFHPQPLSIKKRIENLIEVGPQFCLLATVLNQSTARVSGEM